MPTPTHADALLDEILHTSDPDGDTGLMVDLKLSEVGFLLDMEQQRKADGDLARLTSKQTAWLERIRDDLDNQVTQALYG